MHQPDAGTLLIDGCAERFHHPGQALARGVSLVHQEFSLLPQRSVAENIFLGREPTRRLPVDRRRLDARGGK